MRKLLAVLLAVLLCACNSGKGDYTQETTDRSAFSTSTEDDDNNDDDDIEDDYAVYESSGGFLPLEYRELSFDGGEIQIAFEFEAVGPKNIGFIVFCDGEVTPFYTDEDATTKNIHISSVLPNEETKTLLITFTPIGKKGEKVSVNVVRVLGADFDPNTVDLSEDYYGELDKIWNSAKYRVRCYPYFANITMNNDGLERDESVSTDYETSEIPQEEIDKNIEVKENGTVVNYLDQFNATISSEAEAFDGGIPQLISLKKGEKIDISITLSGANQEVKCSFFVGNEVFPVFDGKNYLKCYIDNKTYVDVNATLDTSELEPGRYALYSFVGNMENQAEYTIIQQMILEVT